MTRITPGATYATAVLPAVVVFGMGLALTVAPVTATAVLAGSGGVLADFTIDDDVLADDDEGSIPPRHRAVDGPPASTRSARAPVV